jgi:hypothetical protein
LLSENLTDNQDKQLVLIKGSMDTRYPRLDNHQTRLGAGAKAFINPIIVYTARTIFFVLGCS